MSNREAAYGFEMYDRYCKRILRYTPILTRILRSYVSELKDCSLSEIASLMGDVQVGSDPVGRDPLPLRFVGGANSEDSDASEGRASFDLRLTPLLPNGSSIRIEIDIEAQAKWDPGYALLKRAIFYCGRLLSIQGDEILPHSEYERLRKVYSIWICRSPSAPFRHKVARFALSQEDLLGAPPFKSEDYDFIEIIMVCLGDDPEVQYDETIDLLNTLFRPSSDPVELRQTLKERFGIILDEETNEEVSAMCNMSEYIWDEGVEHGTISTVKMLVERGLMTIEQALDALDIPMEERARFLEVIPVA